MTSEANAPLPKRASVEHKTKVKSVALDPVTGTYEAICVCSCGWEQGIHESGKLRAGLSAEEMGKEHLADPDAPPVPERERRPDVYKARPTGGAYARPVTMTPAHAVYAMTTAFWCGVGLQLLGGVLLGIGVIASGGDFLIWLGAMCANVGFWAMVAGVIAWAVKVGTIAAR